MIDHVVAKREADFGWQRSRAGGAQVHCRISLQARESGRPRSHHRGSRQRPRDYSGVAWLPAMLVSNCTVSVSRALAQTTSISAPAVTWPTTTPWTLRAASAL